MVHDQVKIRTSIKEELKRYMLFRGTLLALVGMVPILLAGSYMPVETLRIWGLPIFLVGGGLVVWGLLPYKKLCQLEINPGEIILNQDNTLSYLEGQQLKLFLSFKQITKIEWVIKGNIYGAGIWLEKSEKSPAIFLPYFSERAVEKIKVHIR